MQRTHSHGFHEFKPARTLNAEDHFNELSVWYYYE